LPKTARDHSELGDGAAQHDGDEHVLRRLDATNTVHGFRSSFRDWAAEAGVEVSVAEQYLAHAIGSDVTGSYLRTSSWASFVCGETGDKWSSFAGPWRDPSREVSEDMEAPRLGRQTRGKRA
jgi:hypothetical protein